MGAPPSVALAPAPGSFTRGHRGRSVSATQSRHHGDGHGAERGF